MDGQITTRPCAEIEARYIFGLHENTYNISSGPYHKPFSSVMFILLIIQLLTTKSYK